MCDVSQSSFIRPTVFANSVKAIMNSAVTKLLVFIHPLYKTFDLTGYDLQVLQEVVWVKSQPSKVIESISTVQHCCGHWESTTVIRLVPFLTLNRPAQEE